MFNAAVQSLERTMREYFKETQKLVHASLEEREIVYKVQKPLFVSQRDMKAFFEKLKSLFIASSSLTPHFTQYNEGEQQ